MADHSLFGGQVWLFYVRLLGVGKTKIRLNLETKISHRGDTKSLECVQIISPIPMKMCKSGCKQMKMSENG